MAALRYTQLEATRLAQAAELVKADPNTLVARIQQALDKQKLQEKQLHDLQQQLSQQAGASLADQAVLIANTKVVVAELPGVEAKALRGMVDDLKNQLGEGIVMLATVQGEKVALIAGVTKTLTAKVKAGDLVNHVASQVGGKGGGRPDMAQAGGTQPENLAHALNSVTQWLENKL